MKKLETVQTLRALAANLVVASHLLGVMAGTYAGFPAPDKIAFIGYSGVHCFFILSGFVMARASRNARWEDFAVARICRVYPIYWLYLIATISFYVLWRVGLPDPDRIMPSLLLYPSNTAQIVPVAWSLIYEVYFYFVLTLILAIRAPIKLALVAWAVLIIAGNSISPTTPILQTISNPLALEFIVGCFVGLFVSSKFAKTAGVLGLLMLVGGGAGYAIFRPAGLTSELALLALPYAFLLYGAVGLEISSAIRRPYRWITALGDASYSTYLSHFILLPIVVQLLVRTMPQDSWYLTVPIGFVASNVWALVSYRYIEIPIVKVARDRLAGRSGFYGSTTTTHSATRVG